MNTLKFIEDKEETSADRLRRVVKWLDYQHEFKFDGLTVKQIIGLFDKCMAQDVDVIEDLNRSD